MARITDRRKELIPEFIPLTVKYWRRKDMQGADSGLISDTVLDYAQKKLGILK